MPHVIAVGINGDVKNATDPAKLKFLSPSKALACVSIEALEESGISQGCEIENRLAIVAEATFGFGGRRGRWH